MPAMCYLQYFPWRHDQSMGLDHQSASLSCALAEAYYLARTLILPDVICITANHTGDWKVNAHAVPEARATPQGLPPERAFMPCMPDEQEVPIEQIFDLQLLNKLVGVVRQSELASSALDGMASKVVDWHWTSSRVHARCGCESTPLLFRRATNSWFRSCSAGVVNTSAILLRLQAKGHGYESVPPMVEHLLKSGLFFAPQLKAAAAAIRSRLGTDYSTIHVRRGDRMVQYGMDANLSKPNALLHAMAAWFPARSAVYIGTDERNATDFFAPLQAHRPIFLASNVSAIMRAHGASNNYALYAVERCATPTTS